VRILHRKRLSLHGMDCGLCASRRNCDPGCAASRATLSPALSETAKRNRHLFRNPSTKRQIFLRRNYCPKKTSSAMKRNPFSGVPWSISPHVSRTDHFVYREGQSIENVAEALELSEEAVKQRLSRGRKLLKKEVELFC